MQIKIIYFAALRDCVSKEEEVHETKSQTPEDLFSELNEKYSFPVQRKSLKVAVNQSFESFDYSLKENDVVVFIPPMAGG
jgi:molybdopterin converting factor subunit 1